MSHTSSFALMTKLYAPELPFLGAFLRYHSEIGVDSFYLLDTTPPGDNRVIDYVDREFSRERDRFVVIPKTWSGGFNGIYNEHLRQVREDWLAILDIDEFLFLGGRTLAQFVGDTPAEYYFFPWIMTPSDKWEVEYRQTSGFRGNSNKYMVRTRVVKALREHIFEPRVLRSLGSPELKRKAVRKQRKRVKDGVDPGHGGYCIHYFGRGIRDVLLKATVQTLGDHKVRQKPWDEIQSVDDLPLRLRGLAKHSLRQHTYFLDVPYFADYNSELLTQLLSEHLSQSQVERIVDLYKQYKLELDRSADVDGICPPGGDWT